jgi:hypothetical protein
VESEEGAAGVWDVRSPRCFESLSRVKEQSRTLWNLKRERRVLDLKAWWPTNKVAHDSKDGAVCAALHAIFLGANTNWVEA